MKIGTFKDLVDLIDVSDEIAARAISRASKENRPLGDVLAEELIKIGCKPTDQSKESNQTNKTNLIIAPREDIDNDQIYLESTGETLRDL